MIKLKTCKENVKSTMNASNEKKQKHLKGFRALKTELFNISHFNKVWEDREASMNKFSSDWT